MCCNCSVRQKKFWLWGTSIFALFSALIFGLIWPTLFESVLHSTMRLREGSLTYKNWIETPLPMYAEFYMFHWTNPDQVHDPRQKPNFVEKGPYVFQEMHTRNDVRFFDNSTVAFNQTRIWHFRPDLSNGSLDDHITNLNTIAMTVGYALRYESSLMKIIGEELLNWTGESLAVTHTIRDLIFNGYEDKILDLLRRLKLKKFEIPFEKFGWFVDRNGSSIYDGRFHMGTGDSNIADLGMLQMWNYDMETSAFPGECGRIKGTTGELWPPEKDFKKPLSMFVGDVCRTIKLQYDGEATMFDVEAQRYLADESVLDNGARYEESACYCLADAASCPDLAPGVMNVSACKFGAPAFLSFPHFYLGDESYTNKISGMKPNKDKHEFSMVIQRSLGIPLQVSAGMQINLLMDEYFNMGLFKGLPRLMIPMFWFRQSAEITEDLAKSVYWASKAKYIGTYFAYALGGLAFLIIMVAVYISFAKKWAPRHGDDDELLTDSIN